MKFFKPNAKCMGSACSFSVTSTGKGKGIYVEIIKQKSWDDKAKTGTFDSSKENKINLKFTPSEIAEMMIVCQRQKGAVKLFHNTGEITSSIQFYVYNKKDTDIPAGIALSVSKGEKKASVPFTFGEAFLLYNWLQFALNRIFAADYAEQKKLFKTLEETKLENAS